MRARLGLTVVMSALFCAWSLGAMAKEPAGHQHPATTAAHGQAMMHHGGQLFLTSKRLSDMNVYNGKNETLGKVDDLIVDAHTGQVLYGILDTGMFGKNVIVPWQAMQLKETNNKYWYSLNKTKSDLAKAPTFSKSHWPNFTDIRWKEGVDKFYGIHLVARPTVQTNQPSQGKGQLTAGQMILPASRLGRLNVYDKKDVKLGKVENLMIDAHAGQAFYAVVDTSGGRLVPVPWGAFWLGKETNRDNYWLILNKSKEQLAGAPTISKKHWSDFANQQWRITVDDFFGVRTASEQPPTSR